MIHKCNPRRKSSIEFHCCWRCDCHYILKCLLLSLFSILLLTIDLWIIKVHFSLIMSIEMRNARISIECKKEREGNRWRFDMFRGHNAQSPIARPINTQTQTHHARMYERKFNLSNYNWLPKARKKIFMTNFSAEINLLALVCFACTKELFDVLRLFFRQWRV